MPKMAIVPIVMLVLLAVMADGGSAIAARVSGTSQQACSVDADCTAGEVCKMGECRQPCSVDDECVAPEVCQEGTCGLLACQIHYDCPQYHFCYKGYCLRDARQDVYHCDKPGCPPGEWCMTADNTKSRCAEDPAYVCQTACDCGPAHCCKNNQCVKDVDDPWLPGGEPLPGLSCDAGVDATYCCAAPSCFAGQLAYSAGSSPFRCYNAATAVAENHCGAAQCYGTAVDCVPGEACVDTTQAWATQPAGKSCWLRDGGACVSNAEAEAVFGYAPGELIPACTGSCQAGTPCDMGWQSGRDGRYAYERVVATCGSCGNGTCDVGEYPGTCAADCTCGDGSCAPVEVGYCAADCGSCGDGACAAWESPRSCPADCRPAAGDYWCEVDEYWSCPGDCPCPDAAYYPGVYTVCGDGFCQNAAVAGPETCENCARDCGACEAGAAAAEGSAQPYARLFGGSSGTRRPAFAPDSGRGVAVKDATVYVAGQTYSEDFPVSNGPARSGTGWSGFVLQLDEQGNPLLGSYLGSAGGEHGQIARDIAVADDGTVFTVGTEGVMKLTPGGGETRIYTFAGPDGAYGIALDQAGAVYVAGAPAVGAVKLTPAGAVVYQAANLGGTAYDIAVDGDGSAYVAGEMGLVKLAADGTQLLRVDLKGTGYGVSVAPGGVYVAGQTYAQDFGATAGAFDGQAGGAGDAFLAQLDPDGEFLYATYLGGSGYDSGRALAVDREGQVFVTGITRSEDFPLRSRGPAAAVQGGAEQGDAFLAQFKPGIEGDGLVQSVRIGGTEPLAPPYFTPDRGFGIAAGERCFVYLTGEAGTADFPGDPAAGSSVASGFSAAVVMKLAAADVTAPGVTVDVARASLWPVNHALVDVGLRYVVADACDGQPAVAIVVTSDEPPTGEPGSGGSSYAADAEITAEGRVLLRAERSGIEDGRVYVITVMATDAAGNRSSASAAVAVNHDETKPAVDSGQRYEVARWPADGAAVDLASSSAAGARLYLPAVAQAEE